MASMQELRNRTVAFLQQPEVGRTRERRAAATVQEPPPFSLFVPAQLKEAIDLAAHLMDLANATEGDAGLEHVLDAIDKRRASATWSSSSMR